MAALTYVRRGLAAAAVCALFTACGGPTGDQDAVDALRRARQTVAAAGSARIEATMDTGGRLASHSAGTLRWSGGVEGTLTVRVTGGSMAAATRKLGGDPSQTRFLPDAYYTRMTDAFAGSQGGRHWIRHRYEAGSDPSPADSLKALAAAKDLRKAGEETVRGRRTCHYRGTADGQRIDVWIDDHHLLVRRTQRAGDFSSTVHYRDYGTAAAAAERPPARDTMDLEDVANDG